MDRIRRKSQHGELSLRRSRDRRRATAHPSTLHCVRLAVVPARARRNDCSAAPSRRLAASASKQW
eukprot:6187637-Pleurochrysis_carterae.AAC.2